MPFISTNDMVTSWFMQLCRSSCGLIAINFRNRQSHDGHTDKHARNYEGVLLYNRDDFAAPNYIDSSVARLTNKSEAVPSVPKTLAFNLNVATNW
jgi:hypothetical protein